MDAAEHALAILATNVNRNEGYAVTACGALVVSNELIVISGNPNDTDHFLRHGTS